MSGQYILGDTVDKFERSFAKYCGTKYCIGTNNGTMALAIALLVVGVNAGDKVFVPTNSFIATANAVRMIGAIPIFCDVDPSTWVISLQSIQDTIKQFGYPKAIIPVHLFGIMANMTVIMNWALQHNVLVIEDACQAHGSFWNGKPAGSIGDAGCFSFYPTKSLGAYGEAGAIVTNSKEIYKQAISLRNNGALSNNGMEKYIHPLFGYNARISQIQAAILSVKLRYLDKWIYTKKKIVDLYKSMILTPKIKMQDHYIENNTISYHIFAIYSGDRSALMKNLFQHGIQCSIHYPVPIHQQECYRGWPSTEQRLSYAEQLAQGILSLPLYPEMRIDQVVHVAQCINKFYGV